MATIKKVSKYKMSHGLHLQVFTAIVALLEMSKFEAIKRKLGVLADKFSACVEREDQCYKLIRKSDLSKLKAASDHERDNIVAGIKKLIQMALLHYDSNMRDAARRISIVIDTYDRPTPIINQPYDVETITINSLIEELESKYVDDIQTLNLTGWLAELSIRNKTFEQLSKDYSGELAERPAVRPKDARRDTDKAYNNMVEALNGIVQLEGITEYENFVSELNILIKQANDQLAQHFGRLHTKIDILDAEIEPIGIQSYTGKPIYVIPTLKLQQEEKNGILTTKELVFTEDFTVSYKNNIQAGTATLIITGIGKYSGEIVTTFNINE
jgi:hypothetical protein